MRFLHCGRNDNPLFRCFRQEVNANSRENYVWEPSCHDRRDDSGNRENPEKFHENDVCKGYSDAYSEIQSHAAARLTARQRRTNDCQDDNGRR